MSFLSATSSLFPTPTRANWAMWAEKGRHEANAGVNVPHTPYLSTRCSLGASPPPKDRPIRVLDEISADLRGNEGASVANLFQHGGTYSNGNLHTMGTGMIS